MADDAGQAGAGSAGNTGGTQIATGDTGAQGGQTGSQKSDTVNAGMLTQAQAQALATAEADRRVNEALTKERAKLEEKLTATNTDATAKINAITSELSEAREKSAFYEAIGAPGVGVKDPSLAFLAAKHGGHLKDGKLDVAGLKAANPILFGETNTGAARSGAQHYGGGAKVSLNQAILVAANSR